MENTSGQGKLAMLPPELRGWNWGAFFFNWLWGIFNNTFIALLCFIPFVNIIMIFVLGAKEDEWAWQNKRWNSIEQFKRAQKNRAVVGLTPFVLSIIIWILIKM